MIYTAYVWFCLTLPCGPNGDTQPRILDGQFLTPHACMLAAASQAAAEEAKWVYVRCMPERRGPSRTA